MEGAAQDNQSFRVPAAVFDLVDAGDLAAAWQMLVETAGERVASQLWIRVVAGFDANAAT